VSRNLSRYADSGRGVTASSPSAAPRFADSFSARPMAQVSRFVGGRRRPARVVAGPVEHDRQSREAVHDHPGQAASGTSSCCSASTRRAGAAAWRQRPRVVLDHAVRLGGIVAFTDAGNTASQRVLARLGMTPCDFATTPWVRRRLGRTP